MNAHRRPARTRGRWSTLLHTSTFVLLLLPTAGRAASTGASRNVKVSLLSETASIRPGQPFRLGLRLEMATGWHTYWKHPGDSGLTTRLTFKLPEGFAAGAIQWPAPERISAPPLMSYGYERDVLLPVEITLPASLSAADVQIAVRADWLECKEACLPGKAMLDLTLPVRGEEPRPSAEAPLFAEAGRRMPVPAAGWGFTAEAGPKAIALTFEAPDGVAPEGAYFFADQPLVTEYAAAQAFERRGHAQRLTLKPAENATGRPERLTGVLVVEGPNPRAVQVDVAVAKGNPSLAAAPVKPQAARSLGSLPLALLFAFAGGLILNLMPCVLPVLSLKVLGFVRQAGAHPDHVWRHGAAFTAGVLVSFWSLAGVLLVLRAGGEKVGWGFQLQSPPFLVGLSVLFLLLGLNLFGVFEMGASLTGAANLTAGQSGLPASFGNGVLATIIATPCSAPFMGSALGYGLSQSAPVSLGIFTALGLGMATPYLLLSIRPELLRFLPRPGAWMEGFKQLMGFFLMATVAALVWLFGQQTGVDGVGGLLGALVVAAFGAWVYGRGSAPGRSAGARGFATVGALALVGVALSVGLHAADARPSVLAKATGDAAGLGWEDYSEARVTELRGRGTPVFVDFTAAWCLSCQVNERVALNSREVIERFHREGIVALRADWTRRDDRITQALAAFERQGVPVYVLYGRDSSAAPRLLPEVLTPGIVLAAIDETLGQRTTAEAGVPSDPEPRR